MSASTSVWASGIGEIHLSDDVYLELALFAQSDEEISSENPRAVGLLLTIAAGPFGGHRLYYGTSAKVPIFYALTLGGGLGVLPLIDLLVVAFSKDLTPYFDNDKVFMWSN